MPVRRAVRSIMALYHTCAGLRVAHTRAPIHPITVQSGTKFRAKIAKRFSWLRAEATKVGMK